MDGATGAQARVCEELRNHTDLVRRYGVKGKTVRTASCLWHSKSPEARCMCQDVH